VKQTFQAKSTKKAQSENLPLVCKNMLLKF